MRRPLIVALTVALAACGSDSTGPNGQFSGQYALRTVNGSPLPYTFSPTATVVSDIVTLSSDGTYTDDAQLTTGEVLPEQGRYINNNGSLTFYPDDGGSYSGSISGSTLTEFFSGGITEVFERQ